MKDEKINVYTVDFGLANARAVEEMGQCATNSARFFKAENGSDLKKAFRGIAVQLKAMRITR